MGIGSENINPYGDDTREKSEQVRDMFDNIAPAYDFMNRAMTMGIDNLWRKKAVRFINSHLSKNDISNPYILDVATGTADLAVHLANKIKNCKVKGVDLSSRMIEIGKEKIARLGLSNRITLEIADCLNLPFCDNGFSCVTVAYGVRNFQKLSQGYKEMFRVIEPGGFLCVIELSTPTSPFVRPFYDLYTKYIIPWTGRLISKDTRAYAYLPESIAAVAQGSNMTDIIEEAGFTNARFYPMTFGTCTIYTANKPL